MARTILTVPDIECEHCERTIVNALSPQQGVSEVVVDIPAKLVRVTYDEQKIDVDRMKQLLEAEEYPVASIA